MTRPLWEILAASSSKDDTELACDECFAVLEYLADEATEGANLQVLLQTARRHLVHCPDCREHHEQRLSRLELQQAAQSHSGSNGLHSTR